MKDKNYQANSVSNEQFSQLWEDKFEQHIEISEENGKKTNIVLKNNNIDLNYVLKSIIKKDKN